MKAGDTKGSVIASFPEESKRVSDDTDLPGSEEQSH